LVLRHYPVLARVSPSYSEPLGRFPRVTHPCATNPEGSVRLACVRHAASVRSEPESNSQVYDRQTAQGENPKPQAGISGSRSCTSHILWICNETCRDPAGASPEQDPMERLDFNRSSNTQRLPVTGAAAHMSLHLNQQCQRAARLSPAFAGQPN
jgi:hypothetical protein